MGVYSLKVKLSFKASNQPKTHVKGGIISHGKENSKIDVSILLMSPEKEIQGIVT